MERGFPLSANQFKDTDVTVAKKPNPIDVHVGSRVHLRRMLLSMSQEKLGDQMGLTFQQIQKYEKGTNRIGASRLYHIAQILDVPVQFFFDDAPRPAGQSDGADGMSEPKMENFLYEFISTRDGLELIRAFVSIADPKVRKRVVDLVRTLSDEEEASKSDSKASQK
jgi:transcriptional regulator with XRE-family HTH domain